MQTAPTRSPLPQVHEAFDLSGSVAVAHLAALQAEQVITFFLLPALCVMRRPAAAHTGAAG